MPLRVSGKNLDVGESLRAHVLEKVETIMARYFDGRVSGHVVISREGSGYRSDCSLHLSSGVDLHAEGKAQEPYPSVEQGIDKIERRLRRYKTRLKETRAPSADDGAGDDAKSPTTRSRRRTTRRKSPRTTSRRSSPKGRTGSRACRSLRPSPSSISAARRCWSSNTPAARA